MVYLNWDYAALSRVGQAHWLQQLLAPIKVPGNRSAKVSDNCLRFVARTKHVSMLKEGPKEKTK